jgi:large subunit ribosomal protein L32e
MVEKETKKKAAHKSETKTESKTEAKAEVKAETKTAAKTEKAKKEKSKFIPYVEKKKPKKSKEVLQTQKSLLAKTDTPVFRGRFGKKNIRRKSIAKWDKWRKPHGIDLDRGINHGCRPKTGYRRAAELRDIHPSGYREVIVNNVNDLSKIDPKVQAGRIAATVGKRKRNEIVTKANEMGVWILN